MTDEKLIRKFSRIKWVLNISSFRAHDYTARQITYNVSRTLTLGMNPLTAAIIRSNYRLFWKFISKFVQNSKILGIIKNDITFPHHEPETRENPSPPSIPSNSPKLASFRRFSREKSTRL